MICGAGNDRTPRPGLGEEVNLYRAKIEGGRKTAASRADSTSTVLTRAPLTELRAGVDIAPIELSIAKERLSGQRRSQRGGGGGRRSTIQTRDMTGVKQ
jgi:hypothetical protein